MFYDERIESAKGRIAKNAILIAFTVTLVLTPIHCANLLRNAAGFRYGWFALFDTVVFLSTATALAIGLVRQKKDYRDERTESEQSGYYRKAASVLLKIALGAFAFDIPVVLFLGQSAPFADGGPGGVFTVLLFVIGVFVVYSFKKNAIYFNYSLMDNERYYKGVWKNNGKAALYGLGFLGISAASLVLVIAIEMPDSGQIVKVLLGTVGFYAGALIEAVLLYLLYSFLEKCSYSSKSPISGSTILSLLLTIFIYAVYTAGVIFIDSAAPTQTTAVQLVSILSTFENYIRFALLVFLTYFGYEYQRGHRNRLISAGCSTILLSETIAVFAGQTIGSLLLVFVPELMGQDAYIVNDLFSTIKLFFTDASTLADTVGFVLIIFALVKDRLIRKAHRFAIGAFALLGGIELFLRTQTTYLTVNIYHFIVEITVLCYFAFLISRVSRRIGNGGNTEAE